MASSSRVVTVRLNGGLGNQLCDFANALSVAKSIDAQLVLDLRGLEILNARGKGTPRDFGLEQMSFPLRILDSKAAKSEPLLVRLFRETGKSPLATLTARVAALINPAFPSKTRIHVQEEIRFSPDDYCPKNLRRKNHYISGLHLSYKYFQNVRGDMIRATTPQEPLKKRLKDLANELERSQSIAVHVRRGDYVTSEKTARKRVTSEGYFRKSIAALQREFPDPRLYFFSDDIAWCKEAFRDIDASVFVEKLEGESDLEHLYVMSKARSFVISNSSFSWWAAWLSTSSHKLVAHPVNWMVDGSYPMEDIIPDTWNTITFSA